MQNNRKLYTVTGRGFTEGAAGEAERNCDEFWTAPTDYFLWESERNHDWTVRIIGLKNRNGSGNHYTEILKQRFYILWTSYGHKHRDAHTSITFSDLWANVHLNL